MFSFTVLQSRRQANPRHFHRDIRHRILVVKVLTWRETLATPHKTVSFPTKILRCAIKIENSDRIKRLFENVRAINPCGLK